MNKSQLHPLQKKLLVLLANNTDMLLTIREMQDELGASSTSVVAHHLNQLEKKGYLKRNPYNPRDFQILKGPEKQVVYLNLYGLVHCGPNGTILDDNPIERIPISTRLLSFPAVEGFLVKAKGDSMAPKINEGDLVIVRNISDVDSGRVVVCVNNGEAIIKKIQKEKQGNILISLNSKYPPFLAAEDFRVVGEVRGVISNRV
jgi:repressor LexA